MIRERMEIILEILQDLPGYPYSVAGAAAAVVLLLLLLMLVGRRSSPKKAKQGRSAPASRGRSGTPVRGIAVDGLRGDGDFDMNLIESIKNSPMGVVATPSVTTMEPPKPSVDPQVTEQAVKACLDKFQEMYIEMYIGLGLMSDFDQMRTEVTNRLSNGQETWHAISELKMTPEGVVLMQMASVSGSMLQSGEQHIGRGLLGIHGQELFSVYRYALTTLQERGFASAADTQSKLDFMEQKVRELG